MTMTEHGDVTALCELYVGRVHADIECGFVIAQPRCSTVIYVYGAKERLMHTAQYHCLSDAFTPTSAPPKSYTRGTLTV